MARRGSQRGFPSVHRHNYTVGPNSNVPRSMFDRSFGRKQTLGEAGILYPFYWDLMFPGDVFRMRSTFFVRLSTPIHPIMDNMYADVHFWAYPCRKAWTNFKRFMGEQDNPSDSTDYLVPQTSSVTGYTADGLSDYLGLPIGIPGMEHSALWHRTYNAVYNWGYRNQNISDSAPEHTDDGPDPSSSYILRRRQKRSDYFVSCLPWPQKGDPASVGSGTIIPSTVGAAYPTFKIGGNTGKWLESDVGDNAQWSDSTFPSLTPVEWDDPGLEIDAGISINELRQASVVQRILERDARSGTRYPEHVYAAFKVSVPDFRAQNPEFIGSGSFRINVSAVPQTSSTDVTTPQGNLAAFGVGQGQARFTYSAVEHMLVLGIITIRADVTYQQGIPKEYLYKTRYDWFTPDMQGLGEQAVENREIFAKGSDDPAGDLLAFGYQERFAELRCKKSEICGKFRSGDPASLDAWHLSQEFGGVPTLNENFIIENPPVDRVVAATDEPHFIMDSWNELRCARPMAIYGTPGISRL